MVALLLCFNFNLHTYSERCIYHVWKHWTHIRMCVHLDTSDDSSNTHIHFPIEHVLKRVDYYYYSLLGLILFITTEMMWVVLKKKTIKFCTICRVVWYWVLSIQYWLHHLFYWNSTVTHTHTRENNYTDSRKGTNEEKKTYRNVIILHSFANDQWHGHWNW